MIHVMCNACLRRVAEDDADAVTDGRDARGRRADVCGACMRSAAERVMDRLRASVRVVDPVPESVQQRARQISLPSYLTRRR